ncbi:DUF1294 domain-containing protein [uncultured Agrobacterium sp.]|uniref:DUF1294 domain-containing protein n=1 Tax=uncultured Agrobacterium sp. TaxID=157277 RepID=UPI0025CC0F87|nr:DUF1294 domain-containing protein [uncultured Agrobacterium sp.]
MTFIVIALIAYLALNLIVFIGFWQDQRAARKGDRRIRERTLLLLALLGGSLGAVTAQHLLRHKTRKEPFRSLLIGIVIAQVGLVASLMFLTQLF